MFAMWAGNANCYFQWVLGAKVLMYNGMVYQNPVLVGNVLYSQGTAICTTTGGPVAQVVTPVASTWTPTHVASTTASVSTGAHMSTFLSTSLGGGVTVGTIFTGVGTVLAVYTADKIAEWLGLYQSIAGFSCYLGASSLWYNVEVKAALTAFVGNQSDQNALALYNALKKVKSSYCPLVTDDKGTLVKATFDPASGQQKSLDIDLFKTFATRVMKSLYDQNAKIDAYISLFTWLDNAYIDLDKNPDIHSFVFGLVDATSQSSQINVAINKYIKVCEKNDEEWLNSGRKGIPTLGWLIDPNLSKELRLRGMINLISKTNSADKPLNLKLLFYVLTDIILTVARRHEDGKIKGLLNNYCINSKFTFKSIEDKSWLRWFTPDGLKKTYNLGYDLPAYIGKNDGGVDVVAAAKTAGQELIPGPEEVQSMLGGLTSAVSDTLREKNDIKISEDEKVFNTRLLVTAFNMAFELIEQEQNECIKRGLWLIGSRRTELRQAKYSLIKRGDLRTQTPFNAAIRELFYKGWSSEFGLVMWSFFRGYARAWSEVLFTGAGYALSSSLDFAKSLFSSKPTANNEEATKGVINDSKDLKAEQNVAEAKQKDLTEKVEAVEEELQI